jgi:DNA (cytosine-5)-methyltransferase 1
MMKPRLLDLFCCAGGAGAGYAEYFDVTGVDIKPQPHYPFCFIQADALAFLDTADLSQFDVIHASPPCQLYSVTHSIRKNVHPDLVESVRRCLKASSKPYVIENVPGAPLPASIILCGTMFGLKVFRHRLFESNILLFAPYACKHEDSVKNGNMVSVFGNGDWRKNYTLERGSLAMGIDWMTLKELSQAIPPAYTRWIGQFLYDAVIQGREVAI